MIGIQIVLSAPTYIVSVTQTSELQRRVCDNHLNLKPGGHDVEQTITMGYTLAKDFHANNIFILYYTHPHLALVYARLPRLVYVEQFSIQVAKTPS